jgi:CubicO group peptidase (beta-lactamase class C family)
VKGEVAATIDKRLSQFARRDFSGVVLVAQNGVVIFAKGYGFADRARKVPYTTDTVFDIGSITKPFTASAILRLEMDGKLKVTDPITNFFRDVPDDKKEITLHHLQTHTAGFKDSLGDYYDKVGRDEYVRTETSRTETRTHLVYREVEPRKFVKDALSPCVVGLIRRSIIGSLCEAGLRDERSEPSQDLLLFA